ncbi:GTP-binding protein [Alkalihalophilus pseudofirmus]|uniref:CobW family GTP-binding protein n=1 Tax=Alkalihalophilus pseudofirmus TaxID=79885 RepID=UPI00259B9C2A|nr:GTP-binding protein [Alkalihalophilus pseudofirmus]WEG17363.1 GTP-binding protein [Alkalihalophilus pseudofirmus]
MKKKVEVIILSGFLGSGKSTLLSRLLSYEKKRGRKVAVLMNELGKVSIDSSVVPSDIPLKEMLNGCICCSIQGELSVQLKELTEEHTLDVIYIEATGAAHPLDVLDACTHPLLSASIQIQASISVVNSKQWLEQKMSNMMKKLITHQVKFADIVLINKIDQITENELTKVKATIEKENPSAIKQAVTFSQMDMNILHDRNSQLGKLSEKQRDFNTDVKSLHLKTCAIPIEGAINRIQLEEFLEENQAQLLRMKGFIRLTDSPAIYLFNYAYGFPMYERVKSEVQVSPVLVCIGEEIIQEELEEKLKERGIVKVSQIG